LLLTDRIIEQAANYYHENPTISEEVSDCMPVDAAEAVEGAIHEMFSSPYFTKECDRRLVRRLHNELWPDEIIPLVRKHRLSIQTDSLYGRVLQELARQLEDRIDQTSGEPYAAQQKKRDHLARKQAAHPDMALAAA
jgi:hypothetical protein